MDYDDFDNSTTMPILYYDVLSSHARSCQMLAQILKINMDFRSTDSMEDISFDDPYIWINSFSKLPTLMDGSITLCNGHSILVYLCQKYGSKNLPSLCPTDYINRQRITSFLFYEGYIVYRCINHLLSDIFLSKFPNFNVEYHKRKVSNVYSSLNTFLQRYTHMIANRLTIADIAVVSSVGALNIIFPIDHEKFPKLFDWLELLKKTEFYSVNEEGIHKLRYLLRNFAKFPFPSPLTIDSDNMEHEADKADDRTNYNEHQEKPASNAGASEPNNKTEDVRSKTKDSENLSQSDKEGSTESLGRKSGGASVKSGAETLNFYDTYFVNVSKCKYCSHNVSNNIGEEVEVKEDFKETNELYKHPRLESNLSSTEDILKKPLHRRKRTVLKSFLTRVTKGFNRERTENCSKNGEEINDDDSSTTTSEEDIADDGYSKERRLPKHKYNKSCRSDGKESRKICKDAENGNPNDSDEILDAGGSSNNKGHNQLTPQEVQDLVAKVGKLERILETSEKVLKKRSPVISPTISADSSTDSVRKNFPNCCSSLRPFESNLPQCHPQEEPTPKSNCSRPGSTVERLEFDEVTHVVMPESLIKQLANDAETSDTVSNTNDEAQGSNRLEAGHNIYQYHSISLARGLPMRSENRNQRNKVSDNNEKVIKIIYLLCTKNGCKNKNKCRCDDCCAKKKITNSKIPRLISQKPLEGDQVYKITKFATRKFGRDYAKK